MNLAKVVIPFTGVKFRGNNSKSQSYLFQKDDTAIPFDLNYQTNQIKRLT